MGASDGDRKQRQAGSASHADGRSHPNRGCRREPADEILADEDDAAVDKADARDDLRRHSRGIENDPAIRKHVGEAIFGDQDDQRGGEADETVSPQPRALLPDFALKADQRGQNQREAQFRDWSQLWPIGSGNSMLCMARSRARLGSAYINQPQIHSALDDSISASPNLTRDAASRSWGHCCGAVPAQNKGAAAPISSLGSALD